MNSKFKYKIYPDDKFQIHYYAGKINLSFFVKSRAQLVDNPEYNQEFNSIVDFSNANLEFVDGDAEKLVEFLQDQHVNFKKKKTAIVTNSLNQIVLLSFFSELGHKIKLRIKIFSNINSAAAWLRLDKKLESQLKIFKEEE